MSESGGSPPNITLVSDPPPASEEAAVTSPFLRTEEEWEQLRTLLLGREINELTELRRRLDDPVQLAREISTVITEALLLRSGKDERLEAALQTTVENIVRDSVRRDPSDLAGQIFPVMGPAIRRAISETFLSMLQSFNKSLEMSFSWKGLRWRLEAMRTGKPFSEIVLLHTLLYRVEQIFLIHAETGLVLEHLVNEGVETQDADLVSGMLTAVQDFVRDCFVSGDKNDSLDSLQLGDYTIFVERSPKAYLAYVVRGTPPLSLRNKFREMLDISVLECAELLENFNGDVSGFQRIRRHFDSFLVARYVDDEKKLPVHVKFLPAAALILLVGGGLFYYWHLTSQRALYSDAVARLAAEPGIIVTQTTPRLFGTWDISYAHDELARDAASILVEAGMPERKFRLEATPYVAMDVPVTRERVTQTLTPYPGVTISFDDEGTLLFSGTAPSNWIADAREKAMIIPGVKNIDMTQLVDPRSEHFDRAVAVLDDEPGIVVTRIERDRPDGWMISCLQDELARPPATVLKEANIITDGFAVRSTPHISLDEAIIQERVRRAILPPETVDVDFDPEARMLKISGTAAMGWIMATREKALTIAGVRDIDTSGVYDPRTQQLMDMVKRVEALQIHFPVSKDTPIPEDQAKLLNGVNTLVEIEKLARDMGVAVSLTVYGHADATGNEKINYEISQERAKTLAAMLYSRGSSIPISTYGMGADYASRPEGEVKSDQSSRKIELRVHLTRAVAVDSDPL